MNPNHYNINWSWKIVFVTRKVLVQRNCWNEEFHKIRINLLASNGGWQIILDYPRLNHIDLQKWMMNGIFSFFHVWKHNRFLCFTLSRSFRQYFILGEAFKENVLCKYNIRSYSNMRNEISFWYIERKTDAYWWDAIYSLI